MMNFTVVTECSGGRSLWNSRWSIFVFSVTFKFLYLVKRIISFARHIFVAVNLFQMGLLDLPTSEGPISSLRAVCSQCLIRVSLSFSEGIKIVAVSFRPLCLLRTVLNWLRILYCGMLNSLWNRLVLGPIEDRLIMKPTCSHWVSFGNFWVNPIHGSELILHDQVAWNGLHDKYLNLISDYHFGYTANVLGYEYWKVTKPKKMSAK